MNFIIHLGLCFLMVFGISARSLVNESSISTGNLKNDFADLKEELSSLKKEVHQIEDKVINLTDSLLEHGESDDQKHVHFFAKLNGAITLNKNSIVIFKNEIDDYGGNYNNNDGIFTAPVSGYYLFSWTVFVQSGKFVDTELCVENRRIDSMYGSGAGGAEMAETKVVICEVTKGNHVWIQTSYRLSENMLRAPFDSDCSFTGFLIHEK